eukprot:CAMPEP_0194293112 /NCGR_PEP_ID=MMETSP0169-20130528/47177_1 /TAXON_ID=218684 /ORGANISM="Corethron pennatum, Strain L29A3" /LENGTH=157 /DNA_ID=CAMNT_0039041513 /DNA_START=80 /DNA_END=553 /DNA_ORIENTATION=-
MSGIFSLLGLTYPNADANAEADADDDDSVIEAIKAVEEIEAREMVETFEESEAVAAVESFERKESNAAAGQPTDAAPAAPPVALPAIRAGLYRHHKGKDYQVIGVSRHSETGEALVIYQPLYGDYGLFARPAGMFTETVATGVPRFEFVREMWGGAA